MNYLDDFLNNKSYKSLMLMFGFIMICFTDFYKNEIYEFDSTNTTLIYQYNNTNIDKCNDSLKLMNDYKVNNIFTYGLVLILLGCMNFTNIVNRRHFCFITFAILIMNFVFASYIEIFQFYYSCVELIMNYIPQPLILFYINYIFTIGIVAAFVLPLECKRKRNYIEIQNNNDLPKYDDIVVDVPPPLYTSNENTNTTNQN